MNTAAVGAKTARACDYCIRKRARWYCAADDAFLCQACDGSVHSANQLARRHERVRLNISSLKCSSEDKSCIPSWHRGVNRRVRTPRHAKHQSKDSSTTTTTTSNDDDNNEEGDQLQLLYRVPVMDPFELDLNLNLDMGIDMDMDMDMEEFAADVETLLGKGIDGEMGLLDCHVKDEEEMMMMMNGHEMEVMGEPFELTFDYNSPASCDDHEGDLKVAKEDVDDEKTEWRMKLRLDYDAISSAWASHGSPWMNGERPEINPNDCWLHNTMGGDSTMSIPLGGVGRIAGQGTSRDGGREARVTRYREKRRTRLFSKKIRYEVRKLNAEKRPRMKGRFVKRSSFNQLT